MKTYKSRLQAPSLLQLFDAPQDHVGQFGWVCGYSADAAFLNDAAERFTRATETQRAAAGRIVLSVMLDPGTEGIPVVAAPGVAHLPMRTDVERSFRLLHAKVALLGFRHQHDRERWRVRLIVSTGNWTRQTVEDSLDLAWQVEVASDKRDGEAAACADVHAARELLSWIEAHFDARLLSASQQGYRGLDAIAREQVEAWLETCRKRATRVRPRFFDNRTKSLLAQLIGKIGQVQDPGDVEGKANARPSRNYLAMGSGFYEAAGTTAELPKVIERIRSTLDAAGLLTKRPKLDVFVNPLGCQAVAKSVEALNTAGFTVRPAGQPATIFDGVSRRALHAKFLFSANKGNQSDRCTRAWLYLGSGNLTVAGFANRSNRKSGNLEAGVVFAPVGLRWRREKGQKQVVVTDLLPLQDKEEFKSTCVLEVGDGMPDHPDVHLAAPVAWLDWCSAQGWLQPPEDPGGGFEVLDPDGQACEKSASGFAWPWPAPREVRVRWRAEGNATCVATLPVRDESGRIAATPLVPIALDEAWWHLEVFPLAPDGGDPPVARMASPQGDAAAARVATGFRYPIRQVMEIIEGIAAKQTAVLQADWEAWCHRFEHVLSLAAGSPELEYFRRLELNPLSPLRAAPFRPGFAEDATSVPGQRYEAALERVAKVWGVAGLTSI
jgi:hypothetical protein